MVKFRCEDCGVEFSIGDDIFDMVMIYCPCCGDIYSNPVTDGHNYIRFGLENATIHLKTPDEVNEEKEKLRMAQNLVRNVIKDGEEMEKSHNSYKSAVDAVKKYKKEWGSEDLDKAIDRAFGFTNPYAFKAMNEVYDNYESEDKNVSHPSHYQSDSGVEVIDVIEAFTKGLEGIEATDTGNVIKYICRWKNKNGAQDLEKAMWYLQHLLNHVRGKEK